MQPVQDVHEAIQDCVSLLRVPRSCLNICCSSKGAVGGLLSIQEYEDGPWIDCCASGYKALPGDCNAILNYCFQTTAQYILMVEKDVSSTLQLCRLTADMQEEQAEKHARLPFMTLQAIFQRLVEDSFCDLAPSIIVTGKGMPDLSTRVFLRQLHAAFPQLPVLGLVDWNPSGGNVDRHTPGWPLVAVRTSQLCTALHKHTLQFVVGTTRKYVQLCL